MSPRPWRRVATAALAGLAAAAILVSASPASADPPTPPLPKGKVTVPDVKPPTTHRPSAGSRGGTAPAPAPAEVVAVTDLGGGQRSVTFYDPIAGVTAQQLYQSLLARGVKGVVNPSSQPISGAAPVSPVVATASSCPYGGHYGTANLPYCPAIHWANNGYWHPQVYFVDRTPDPWPVDAAVPVWNETEGIDSWYRWWNCPNIGGTHCVVVTADSLGYGIAGQTTVLPVDSGYNMIDGRVRVQLNGDYANVMTAARRRKTVCHELGHALGLDHNSSTDSCMFFGDSDAQRPDGDDFTLLAAVYAP